MDGHILPVTHKKTGWRAGFFMVRPLRVLGAAGEEQESPSGEKKSLATRANPLAGKNDPCELVASPGVAPR